MVLVKLGRQDEAADEIRNTRSLDPLDWWSRHLAGEQISCDTQTRFDLVLDFASAGFFAEALTLLDNTDPDPGTAPLVFYYRGWLLDLLGEEKKSLAAFLEAPKASADYCFPSRLDEIPILQWAMRVNPNDARAPYYLGNLLYDRRRHVEAIALWEKSVKLDSGYSVVWRNLGIGYFNVSQKPALARRAYEKAFRTNPDDARLLYERDQLWKRLGVTPSKRLLELEKHPKLVDRRDDLAVEICALYNQTGQHLKALAILSKRNFQPWEGGEGQALGQYVRTHLALGRRALQANVPTIACEHFRQALDSPPNLSEAKHLLSNQSNIHYWLGVALDLTGNMEAARRHWKIATEARGDFQEMSVRIFSEMSYYSALSLERLGRKAASRKLFRSLLSHAHELSKSEARIDYFATSLPTMLLFDDDIRKRQKLTALFLRAQAELGIGNRSRGISLVRKILLSEPSHAAAADLLGEQML